MALIENQLQVLELKLTQIGELVARLKAENAHLTEQNDQLQAFIDTQKQLTNEPILQVDNEDFESKLSQVKKIKREVEQTLRDAERRLEALRF